jgi:hypothetical protein
MPPAAGRNRRRQGAEDRAGCRCRPPRSPGGAEGRPDRLGQRQPQRRGRFRWRDRAPRLVPMEVGQGQGAPSAHTQAQPARQQQESVSALACGRPAVDGFQPPEEERLLPPRGEPRLPRLPHGGEPRTAIRREEPTQGEEPPQGTAVGDNARQGVRLHGTAPGQAGGHLPRTPVVPGADRPRRQNLQEERQCFAALLQRRGPQLQSRRPVRCIVSPDVLSGGKQTELFRVRPGRDQTAGRRKVCKDLDPTRPMTPPSCARRRSLPRPRALRFHKARGQRRGKLVSPLLLVRNLDEGLPESAIPIP